MFAVSVEHTFSAGHALRNYKGKCENVHGHNYRIRVRFEGEHLNPTGMLIDFTDVKRVLRAATERLMAIAQDTLGDLLPVRPRCAWYWTLGMTWELIKLRGTYLIPLLQELLA